MHKTTGAVWDVRLDENYWVIDTLEAWATFHALEGSKGLEWHYEQALLRRLIRHADHDNPFYRLAQMHCAVFHGRRQEPHARLSEDG
jgi:hypothetical protein